MDELIREIKQFSDLTSTFTLLDVAMVFGLSFVLSLCLGFVYRFTHKGVSYSQSFVHTLVVMCIVVAFLMLIIGSNLARAFTLVGAMSIIRFRNAIKETRDLGFVFMAMAIGMACGTRFYLLAVFAAVFLGGAVMLMSRLNLFAKVIRERILIVQLARQNDFHETFGELFREWLNGFNVISIETVRNETLQEVVCSVELLRGRDPTKFLEEVRARNGNQKVSLILGQQEMDL